MPWNQLYTFFHFPSVKATTKPNAMHKKEEENFKSNSLSVLYCAQSTNHEMNEMCPANHKSTDIIIYRERATSVAQWIIMIY